MRTIVEHLLALQNLLLHSGPASPEQLRQAALLRQTVPPPVLAHFDRMVRQGRNGAAFVRHGVCGECHIRVPVGTLASLIAPRDVLLCDNCSCYLYLPADELPAVQAALAPKKPTARRTRASAAAPLAGTSLP